MHFLRIGLYREYHVYGCLEIYLLALSLPGTTGATREDQQELLVVYYLCKLSHQQNLFHRKFSIVLEKKANQLES